MNRVLFKLLLLLLISASAYAQTVTGKVTAASDGTPLPGVSILVKGSTGGTATDASGNFTLQVPDVTKGVLTVSFIGYATQEVALEGRTAVTVSLAEDVEQLAEVVVTALGISKAEEKIGYSVTTVGGDQLNRARETNVAYSLAGRVAGLNISGVNGGPGSSARILLRGMSSFSASSPLFVINGVPIDNTQRGSAGEWGGADQGDGISNLNPDDIENMTVLKGAAASALYGARAANGVIVITTKGAKKGSFSVEYNLNYSLEKAINFTDFQYEYGQGQYGKRPVTVDDALKSGVFSWGEKLDNAPTLQFDGNLYPYSAAKKNIQNFYQTAPTMTNTVSVSKGTDNGAFRLSLSNLDNKSILRNSGITRKTINLNVDQKITDKLKVSFMGNYIDESSKNRPQLSDGPMNANNITYLATNIDQRVLNPGYDATTGAEMKWNNDIYVSNPWFVVNQYVNDVERKRLISMFTTRYDITPWLYAQARLGYDVMNDRYYRVTPWGTAYSNNLHGGLDDLSRSQTSELNTDILFGAKKNITTDFSTEIFVGANLRKNKYETIGINGSPFVLPYFYSYNNVVNFNRSYKYTGREVHSAYYTVDLAYKSILTLTTTGRYDAYSTLPGSARTIFTPSVSGSFVFSELTDVASLSYGKLRASYGLTSGEPADPYITSSYYSVGATIRGTSTGNFSQTLPNLTLKPFTLAELEVGTELKFVDGRVGLDVAYFSRKTQNEIISGTLSPASGYTKGYVGTGSTTNSGVELLLSGTPVQGDNFNWKVSFNFTYINNRIREIYGPESTNTTLTLGTYRPLNANTALVKGLAGPQVMAYDYVYKDNKIVVDADGIPIRSELQPMGSVLPKTYGGLNNEFSYKGVTLAFLLDFKAGNKVLSATNYYSMSRGLNKETLVGREEGVHIDGVHADGTPNTKSVEAQAYYQELATRISSLNVLDGSFLKLRQVTLGYSLPAALLKSTPIKSLTFSLVGRNLWTIIKHTDNIDPEAGFSPLIQYAGIEGGSLPSTRSYGFNLNVKF